MLISKNDLEYMIAVIDRSDRGEPIIRRENLDDSDIAHLPLNYCTECDSEIEYFDQNHAMMQNGNIDNPIILICCEGYHPLAR